MSEDKTQNGYEGSQELDFQDAKEMTVGEAVRKEAEINAGVTETDSILDKYIKQHREEVASQKFSKKIEADGDTSPLDAFIQKQRQEFADSGLISQSMANESINSTTATEEVTPVTFGFGATDNKADETQSHIDKQLPNAPVEPEVIAEPESQSSEVIITSTNADRFITSETEKFDLGDALADSSTSTNQPAYNDALVDNIDDNNPLIANIDDPEPQNPVVANIDDTEPQASNPLLDDVTISDTIDLAAIASTVAGVTGAKADEEKITPKVSMAVNRPSAEDRISSESISPSHKSAFDGDIPVYRRKGVVIGALAVLALAIIGGSYALYKGTHSQSAKTTSTASSAVTSSSSKDTSAADNKAFEEMYKNFFTDDEQTKLANDQFGKLSDLEKMLKKLEKTKYYDAAKKKYDNLKKQIEAVQKINSQFESDALVDGSYNASIAVKSDANFNNLPESVTTTGNASLDSTIQEAIKGGKTQLEEKAKAASATSAATAADSANTASPAAPSGDNTSGAASTGGGAAASNTSGAQNGAANSAGSTGSTGSTGSAGATGGTTGGSAAASTVVTRGITNYNPSILQRDRSRVPYNANVVADTSNPAWTWADGVLDKIIETSHSRGYFSGDNFILEPVNIINGNGYYNLYLPDGTYLFSINCKTGYYVGNGSGHSDKLDY
ncbi:MAG: cell division site-positioning protein MapZ family protein [Streptococcus salivarius]|nr:cell division site-positioning protein MapZ family protein [Streptococcus salivarius]